MSDVKALLEAATPLPWEYRKGRTEDVWGKAPLHELQNAFHGADGIPLLEAIWHNDSTAGLYGREADAALIVYAVNRLSDYETAVEALERLLNHHDYLQREGCEDSQDARAALAALREGEAAHV